MTRYLADIGSWRVPKSGHVTITKIENLHIDIRRKIHSFQKCYYFRSTTKMTKLSRKNRFRTLASPGACERLGVLSNWRLSSIHPSSLKWFQPTLICQNSSCKRWFPLRFEFLSRVGHAPVQRGVASASLKLLEPLTYAQMVWPRATKFGRWPLWGSSLFLGRQPCSLPKRLGHTAPPPKKKKKIRTSYLRTEYEKHQSIFARLSK